MIAGLLRGAPVGGLSFPNDPVGLSTAGWTQVNDSDCDHFDGTTDTMPPATASQWWIDNEYGPVPDLYTDGASPTGKQVWRYTCPAGQNLSIATGTGTVGYKFSTPPRKLYHGFYFKFSNPMAGGIDEVHSVYYQPMDIVLDIGPGGDFDLFGSNSPGDGNADHYTDPGYFSVGNWVLIEVLLDAIAKTGQLFVAGNPITFKYIDTTIAQPGYGSNSTFQWIDFNSTWHGGGTASVQCYQYVAHHRVSVYV